ncbi:HIT family protein, partial [uncultured Methanomethylovorans sp.]|uniref:HIT family protein n=1 Tax=uncultured Methanomethylovorans sp. TaxID=183759 RepID=UPI003183847F
EAMYMECIFCKIISGSIPSYKVYEDELVFAFLDIYPCSEGHTVVLPKKHIERFTDLDVKDASDLFASVHKISKVVSKTFDLHGMNIGMNVGEVAGQSVPHVHVHIIPRKEGDNGGSMHSIVETNPDTGNLADLAKKVRESF